MTVEPDGLQIRVDRVREALRFAAGRPYEAARRVVWVRSAEALNDEGSNALLKSLEEPGQSLAWILTTIRPESLLPTILSRCEQERLPRATPRQAARALQDRGLAEADAADALAFGLDPEEEDLGLEELREMRRVALEALAGPLPSSLLALAARAEDDDRWAAVLAGLFRDAAILASGAAAEHLRHRSAAARIQTVAARFPADRLARAAAEADRLPQDFRRRQTKQLAYERVLLRLLG